MDVKTYMSMTGQGSQVSSQMMLQNSNAQQRSGPNMNAAGAGIYGETIKEIRESMRHSIYKIFARRCPQSMDYSQIKRFFNTVKQFEEMLFRKARSLEDYMNQNTLESRLQELTRYTMNFNQRRQHINSSSSIGTTMIPTPCMSHSGNSNYRNMPGIDAVEPTWNIMKTTNSDAGSLLPTAKEHSVSRQGDSFYTSDGFLLDGSQQSLSNFSMVSVGNHMPTVAGQRMSSQYTHGFIGSNNQSFAGLNSSNNVIHSTVEPTMATQQQQKYISGQNSSTEHKFSSHTGNGIGSALQHKPYRLSSGGFNGQVGLMDHNMQHANTRGTSGGYLGATFHHKSAKPSSLQLVNHQSQLTNGDSDGTISAKPSGTENFLTTSKYVSSMMDTQDSVNLQTVSKANATLLDSQSNFNCLHHDRNGNPLVERTSYLSPLTSRGNMVQSSQQQCFQKQPHRFHSQQQYGQQQYQLKSQSQHVQIMLENGALNQTQLASNLVTQINSEPGMGNDNMDLQQQISEQFQLPENQTQLGSGIDSSRFAQSLSTSSSQQNAGDYVQPLHLQGVSVSQSDYSTFHAGVQPEAHMENQLHSQSVSCGLVSPNISLEHVKKDFHQRICGQDEAQSNRLSSEGPLLKQSVVSRSTVQFSNSSGATCRDKNLNHEQKIKNQQKWILLLQHASFCRAPEGECQEPHCRNAQKLLKHNSQCSRELCDFQQCHEIKKLLNHIKNCEISDCPVCFPVRDAMQQNYVHHASAQVHKNFENTLARSPADPVSESLEVLQPPFKRLKTGQAHSPVMEEVQSRDLASVTRDSCVPQNLQKQDDHHGERSITIISEVTEIGASLTAAQEIPSATGMKNDTEHFHNQMPRGESNKLNNTAFLNGKNIVGEKESRISKKENVVQPTNNVEMMPEKQNNNTGVSLIELFSLDQVKKHIDSLKEWTGQSKAKAEKNQALGHSGNKNSCQLCLTEKLAFAPPPIYCAACGIRIKKNATYYTAGAGEARQSFCIPCYNKSRGDSIVVDGVPIQKLKLQKMKNDKETEEWWVQCDKCEGWQHQICALFNGKKNDGGQAEYQCPNCYLAEVKNGERQPLPENAVLGAKDLPKCKLSNHLEERIIRRLNEDRVERARLHGTKVEEVPGAEELVIRVVSSVDKKLEVKPRFLEIFQEENYPTEFPYKSKAVLLFQRIEGVEVCLFGMYLQEFGSECAFPNQRRVYLSYLDSVKYFRPEIKAASGEALRTFVYHEILIGYLEYCKMRGFTSCYIWACPPLKGEDYILYCHPDIQKTPKSDKLRDWYLAMLGKAKEENIVVELTNMYDHFFVQMQECRAKVTASRLPYFDGDYWPGAAEDLIYQIQQEANGIQPKKKGSTRKTSSKRDIKASGQSELSGKASKDLQLMHKLGGTICPMKEDFIMVHLQHCCKHCCVLLVSGTCWVCQQCKTFQLCDECYEAERNREDEGRHPVGQKEKHTLSPIQIVNVPSDTRDEDEIFENEFFDTRQTFLSLCQGNHYQYDTLRRAKHSSMMILYHLHNPTAPAFVTTCNECHQDIEAGQTWRCEVCPDYDVCNACYQREGVIKHSHKLTNRPGADRSGQNKEARQSRTSQLRTTLDLLVHASECRVTGCQYMNCRKLKRLFFHANGCRIRMNGGCPPCRGMWSLLQLHARHCRESQCSIPRCQDLKKHMRRLQELSESRRRTVVNEFSRMRAAEISC